MSLTDVGMLCVKAETDPQHEYRRTPGGGLRTTVIEFKFYTICTFRSGTYFTVYTAES